MMISSPRRRRVKTTKIVRPSAVLPIARKRCSVRECASSGICTRGSRGEVVRSPECREFLRHRHVDQLVKRYPFSFRELTRFFQERRLQPQRKITLPHDIPPDRKSTRLNSSHLGISYA